MRWRLRGWRRTYKLWGLGRPIEDRTPRRKMRRRSGARRGRRGTRRVRG
jgi:hypothetical protein